MSFFPIFISQVPRVQRNQTNTIEHRYAQEEIWGLRVSFCNQHLIRNGRLLPFACCRIRASSHSESTRCFAWLRMASMWGLNLDEAKELEAKYADSVHRYAIRSRHGYQMWVFDFLSIFNVTWCHLIWSNLYNYIIQSKITPNNLIYVNQIESNLNFKSIQSHLI